MKHKIPPHINNNVTTENIIINLYLVALALILNAFYKQGVIPFRDQIISYNLLFKPFLLPLLGYLIGLLIAFISDTINHQKITFKLLYGSWLPLFGLYMTLISSINTSLIWFIINCSLLLISYKMLATKTRLNLLCLSRLFGALILVIINNYSYLNHYEQVNAFALSPIRLLTNGLGSSLGASNIILLLIIYAILFRTTIYKRQLPLTIIGSYLGGTLIIYLITHSPLVFNNILYSELVFVSIIIAPLSQFSPYTKKGILTFGILTGILGAYLVNYISIHEGLYLAVLMVSIFSNKIDQIMAKIKFKKEVGQ